MLSYWFFFFKQKTAYEMRISDWSSDVCSSDLHALLQELQRTVDPELIVREGIDAMGQAHEPPAVGIVGGELGRHPELAQGGKVERRPAGESRLQPLDYLVPRISIHAIKIARRSEEHTSELQSLMRISYAVFCLKKKKKDNK